MFIFDAGSFFLCMSNYFANVTLSTGVGYIELTSLDVEPIFIDVGDLELKPDYLPATCC